MRCRLRSAQAGGYATQRRCRPRGGRKEQRGEANACPRCRSAPEIVRIAAEVGDALPAGPQKARCSPAAARGQSACQAPASLPPPPSPPPCRADSDEAWRAEGCAADGEAHLKVKPRTVFRYSSRLSFTMGNLRGGRGVVGRLPKLLARERRPACSARWLAGRRSLGSACWVQQTGGGGPAPPLSMHSTAVAATKGCCTGAPPPAAASSQPALPWPQPNPLESEVFGQHGVVLDPCVPGVYRLCHLNQLLGAVGEVAARRRRPRKQCRGHRRWRGGGGDG